MPQVILLDTGVLSNLLHPNSRVSQPVSAWLARILDADETVVIPEIADYELRRELIRAGKWESIERLDGFNESLGYLPITTPIMRRASEYWAVARQRGCPAADDRALDGDMILAATATLLGTPLPVVVATTNALHFTLFCDARHWKDIA